MSMQFIKIIFQRWIIREINIHYFLFNFGVPDTSQWLLSVVGPHCLSTVSLGEVAGLCSLWRNHASYTVFQAHRLFFDYIILSFNLSIRCKRYFAMISCVLFYEIDILKQLFKMLRNKIVTPKCWICTTCICISTNSLLYRNLTRPSTHGTMEKLMHAGPQGPKQLWRETPSLQEGLESPHVCLLRLTLRGQTGCGPTRTGGYKKQRKILQSTEGV